MLLPSQNRMDDKSIFYTSNSHTNIFPSNSRGSFVSHIDENEFGYLGLIDKKNVKIGLKEITFENTYNTFRTKYGSPNMVIIQDNYGKKIVPSFDTAHPGPESPEIDIKSGWDYYILSDQSPPYTIGKKQTQRSFTDVKISCFFKTQFHPTLFHPVVIRFVVHNIYFHESPHESDKEFISYLNYVYHNIEFDAPTKEREELFKLDRENKSLFEVDKNGLSTFWDKRHLGLDIFLSNDISQLLGFTKDLLVEDPGNSLQEIVSTNFKSKKLPTIGGNVNELEYIQLYQEEDLQTFTTDTNVQYILDFDWGSLQRYLRIPQDRPVMDSIYSKVTSANKIHLEKQKPILLGLRTSLSKPDIFKNCSYDTQIEFLNVRDMTGGIQTFEVEHPSLYNTSIEKISNAKFELIDIDTGEGPNFAAGTPTFIHSHVSHQNTMNNRFNLFLDSSDKLYNTYFPTNTPVDFRIKLPERLEFTKRWEIALKNIFIGNDLFNIYSESCWFSVKIIDEKTFDANLDERIFLEDGLYKTVKEVCDHVQALFKQHKFDLKISLKNKSSRIKITYEGEKLTIKYAGYTRYILKMSPMLANILGFSRAIEDGFDLHFDVKRNYSTTYSPNINLLVPRNFMILCDIVSESVFGSKSIKILKLLSTNFDSSREIINFNFHQDEFVGMAITEFMSIRIQIVDTTGDLIRSKHRYPTRCQIQFMMHL